MTGKTHDTAPLLAALAALDGRITDQQGGEPGTGIATLLDLLARQFLGIPAAVPAPPAPPPAELETAEQASARLARERPAFDHDDDADDADHRRATAAQDGGKAAGQAAAGVKTDKAK